MKDDTEKVQSVLDEMNLQYFPIPVTLDEVGVQGFAVLLNDGPDYAELTRRTRKIDLAVLFHDWSDHLAVIAVRP